MINPYDIKLSNDVKKDILKGNNEMVKWDEEKFWKESQKELDQMFKKWDEERAERERIYNLPENVAAREAARKAEEEARKAERDAFLKKPAEEIFGIIYDQMKELKEAVENLEYDIENLKDDIKSVQDDVESVEDNNRRKYSDLDDKSDSIARELEDKYDRLSREYDDFQDAVKRRIKGL